MTVNCFDSNFNFTYQYIRKKLQKGLNNKQLDRIFN